MVHGMLFDTSKLTILHLQSNYSKFEQFWSELEYKPVIGPMFTLESLKHLILYGLFPNRISLYEKL